MYLNKSASAVCIQNDHNTWNETLCVIKWNYLWMHYSAYAIYWFSYIHQDEQQYKSLRNE